uniref:Retrotransposon gag domain-containing protein n=1 Tax=Fagus sylvatica TaxID=28930 RepID=A0A2N9I6E0_FAGSY
MTRTKRKEDNKNTNDEVPEGHPHANTTPSPPTPPRPPMPPKSEGKDSQIDSKIDSLEEKIRLMQGHAAEWYSQLKKISHWKELADTFLAQYGFNSQIAPDWFDLQRMEKKSNKTFKEYAQRWREKAARACPPLDEKEMIKIFVDTLKNPYFDRMIGLQLQFFVDLIPMGERIEDATKTKKIVDMSALLALAEQAAKKASAKKKEGDVQMIGRSNGRPRQALPTFTMQPIQPMPTPIPTPAPAPAPAPQMPARPVGNQTNDNRPTRREPRQFTSLPMPLTQLYPILIEKNLISPVVPRPYNGPQRRDFDQNLTCDFHFGEVGHAVENCQQLRHQVQDLIDHGILKFEGLPNITTNPLPNHPGGEVNMVEIKEEDDQFNLASDRASWKCLFHTLKEQGHITPLEAPPGPSTGDTCKYHSGARGHSLECCKEFKDEIASLTEKGLIRKEETQPRGSYQPYDPSDLDWYAELDLDNILEEDMDLDDLLDEEDSKGYYIEEDADEWRAIDFCKLLQFPCLIVPRGFETPEFEIFYENGDSESHLQKYCEKMALHVENELLMISVFPESLSRRVVAWFYQLRDLTGWEDLEKAFLEQYRFNTKSILEYLGLKEDEEPYIIPDLRVKEVIVEIKGETEMSSLPALTNDEEEEEKTKIPPTNDLNISTTTVEEEEEPTKLSPAESPNSGTPTAEEVQTGPAVEELSINAITTEGDSTMLPIRYYQ